MYSKASAAKTSSGEAKMSQSFKHAEGRSVHCEGAARLLFPQGVLHLKRARIGSSLPRGTAQNRAMAGRLSSMYTGRRTFDLRDWGYQCRRGSPHKQIITSLLKMWLLMWLLL